MCDCRLLIDQRRPRIRLPPQPIDGDRGDQQHAGQHASELRRERRKVQPVLQDRERQQTEQRPPQCPASTEHRGPAENDRGNRIELVSRSGVGFRLTEVCHVDDRGKARHHTRQHVHQPKPLRDGNPRVSSAGGGEADRVERAAEYGPMQQNVVRDINEHEEWQLRRDHTPQVPLSEEQKATRKTAVIHGAVRQPLGNPAEQRQRTEGHDERRQIEARNEQRV